MVIQPRGELQRDTTYVVRLKPGYRDQHGVVGTSSREFAFATGAALDTAYISGTVLFKREPSGKAVVRAFRVPRDPTFQPEAARPDRETGTARDGTFKVKYLPANDARFVLMAFVDQNGNGTFDKAEPFAVLPDTITLTPLVTQFAGVQIKVIDPNEKGIVRGTVANETGIDSVLATVALYAPTDTTRARYLARCDSAGVVRVSAGDAGSVSSVGVPRRARGQPARRVRLRRQRASASEPRAAAPDSWWSAPVPRSTWASSPFDGERSSHENRIHEDERGGQRFHSGRQPSRRPGPDGRTDRAPVRPASRRGRRWFCCHRRRCGGARSRLLHALLQQRRHRSRDVRKWCPLFGALRGRVGTRQEARGRGGTRLHDRLGAHRGAGARRARVDAHDGRREDASRTSRRARKRRSVCRALHDRRHAPRGGPGRRRRPP